MHARKYWASTLGSLSACALEHVLHNWWEAVQPQPENSLCSLQPGEAGVQQQRPRTDPRQKNQKKKSEDVTDPLELIPKKCPPA